MLTLRFAGYKAPPSPEVEAGPFLPLEEQRVKLLLKYQLGFPSLG
jgi:hypothetical protein